MLRRWTCGRYCDNLARHPIASRSSLLPLGMNEPIETLLFDFGGTLDANGVAWKERFYGFYRAEGLEMAPEAFEPGFFAANSSLVGNLPAATDLSGTVHALVANLEVS